MSKYYSREVLKLFAKVVSPALPRVQSIPDGKSNEADKPVFIIGAPRTGSTILYQLLTNELDVTYIDNLVDVFHRNFVAALKTSNKLFGSKPHNCFKSVHGNTWKCGMHAPSECGDFWYQWLPRDKHYITVADVNQNVVGEIKNNIDTALSCFRKPFIFKNMNAGLRLQLINAAVPDAKFIFVKRDPVDTAISILNVRKKIHGTLDKWWSLIPQNYEELLLLPPAQQVVMQIYRIEKQINSDLKLFSENNMLIVNYSDIMASYKNVMENIRQFINLNTQYREGAENPNLKEQKGSVHDLKNEIEKAVKDLDWNGYTS